MPEKLLHNMSDEKPDLQKQMGCMNGIFHLFDRHHFMGIHHHSRKRLPPAAGQKGNPAMEPTGSLQKTMEKSVKKASKEKQRVSAESSGTSLSSSSCSSSFSSNDCNKTSHPVEQSSFSPQTVLIETPTRESLTQHQVNTSELSRKPVDLRDFVKDSIHRETRGVLVKTATKEEPGYRTLRYIDSPRPLQQLKSNMDRFSSLNESYRILPQFQASSQNCNERNGGCLNVACKDGPRFSYDGRESLHGIKSITKLKEHPRLSLDSKQRTVSSSSTVAKSHYLLGEVHGEIERNISNQQQETGSYRRPSSVVAKLMGLEGIPNSTYTNPNKTTQIETSSILSQTTDGNKQIKISGSPNHSHKEPASPRQRRDDSVKKTIIRSKFPTESAPWRQKDEGKSQTSVAKTRTKASNSSLYLYGEIEKRLAHLEFQKSGNEPRALKQIPEAIYRNKDKIERKNDYALNLVCQTSNNNGHAQILKSPVSAMAKGNISPKSSKSANLIMEPAKLNGKAVDFDSASTLSSDDTSSVLHRLQTGDSDRRDAMVGKRTDKDLTLRPHSLRESTSRLTSAKTLRSAQKGTQTTFGEKIKSGKSSRHKNIGLEKQSCLTAPSANLSKIRRQPGRQKTELGSSVRISSPKFQNVKQINDQFSDVSIPEFVDLSHQCDDSTLQSERNISLPLNTDIEVTSIDRSNTGTGTFLTRKEKNLDSMFDEEELAEPSRLAQEQPSPISVLDASFFRDESPSPVKKKSMVFKDEEPLNFEEEWIHEDLNHLPGYIKPKVCSEHDHESTHEEFKIKETASIYDSVTPDHKYISEILLASGLLGDLGSGVGSIQLHPSGFPTNTKLFLALEKSKRSSEDKEDNQSDEKIGQTELIEKLQNKLVFDAVNEILGQKLLIDGYFQHSISSSVFASKRERGEQLLRDICSQIDRLQANSSTHRLNVEDSNLNSSLWGDFILETTGWTNPESELPGIVLDVERLIFKDLISEAVSNEVAAALRGRPSCAHRRKLFHK